MSYDALIEKGMFSFWEIPLLFLEFLLHLLE